MLRCLLTVVTACLVTDGIFTWVIILVKKLWMIRICVTLVGTLWVRRQNSRLLLKCLAVSVRFVLMTLLALSLRPGIELVCVLLDSSRPWPILQALTLTVRVWIKILLT